MNIIHLILLIFLVFNLGCKTTDTYLIRKIKVRSINWSITTRVPLTPKTIWGVSDCFNFTIDNKDILSQIEKELKIIKNEKVDKSIDVRISCLIYKNDFKIDTLSFGRI